MNCEHVTADAPLFRRIIARSAPSRLYSGMIFAGQVGKGGGVGNSDFLSVELRAKAGIGGTGGGGEQRVGEGGGEQVLM